MGTKERRCRERKRCGYRREQGIEWMQTLNKETWRAGEVRGRDVVMELSNNEKRHWMDTTELENRVAND